MLSPQQLSLLIEEYIAGLPLPEAPHGLYDPIRYSLAGSGKRIRPLLVLAACQACGGDVGRAMPAAAALEVYHNFTLLHDDIMDNAPVRRGKPAVHRQWDVNTAILSGDAMLICAYRILGQLPPELFGPVFAEYSRCWLEVCHGQQYDMEFEGRGRVSIDEYTDMISRKTAALLACGARAGAMAAGADARACEAAYMFGKELGLAFQIQDDILDLYGTRERLGKQIGGDIAEGKKTYLLLSALERATPEVADQLQGLIADRTIGLQARIDIVRALYDRLGVEREARQAVRRHTDAAIGYLEGFAVDHAAAGPLREIVSGLTEREK